MFPETDLANKKLFDMSESYFSQDQLPLRAANLLPDALVFITLSDPVTRAFAVYKVRDTLLNFSIIFNDKTSKLLCFHTTGYLSLDFLRVPLTLIL